MQVNKQIDTLDKKLLNEIQWVFPLTERPFLEISKRYNVSEDEIIQRIAYMKG
ncbi:MAG: AsnC family protein, partial [Nitrososphaeraceae archaeon]